MNIVEIVNNYGEKLSVWKSKITRTQRIFLAISKNGITTQISLEEDEIQKLKNILNQL